ncbi:MAG: type II toxin-antitoxin system RelE/ParE family toxin [Burkholderiaceae bacterium]|nr:type II toxin-antitoxin system RelE/ParE family toxin [Burkholderiaceae bacterium]
MKPAFQSSRAKADILEALDFYIAQAPHVAGAFLDSLEKSTAQIQRQPGIGSPRYAQELNIPRLRHWRLARFPYALFYIEHAEHLDVIRLAHLASNIPLSLRED